MPPDQIMTLPGYDPDVQKNRNQARQIMQKLGYGPDKPLNIKVTTRDWFVYRDPAVLLIDQLKHVYIDGELELIQTAEFSRKSSVRTSRLRLTCRQAGRILIRPSSCFTDAVRASTGTATAIPRSTR